MRNANVALLQLCSGENSRDNLAQIEQQLKQLNGAIKLVLTPENALLFSDAAGYRQHAEREGDGPLWGLAVGRVDAVACRRSSWRYYLQQSAV